MPTQIVACWQIATLCCTVRLRNPNAQTASHKHLDLEGHPSETCAFLEGLYSFNVVVFTYCTNSLLPYVGNTQFPLEEFPIPIFFFFLSFIF